MTQDGSKRPRGFTLTVATLALALVVLGAINVWRWLEARRRAVETSGVESPVAPAVAPPSGVAMSAPGGSTEPRGGTGIGRPESTSGDAASTRPAGDLQGPATGGTEEGPGGHAASPLAATGVPGGGAALPGSAVPGSSQPVPDETVVPPGTLTAGIPSKEERSASPKEARNPEGEPPADSDRSSDRTPPVLGHLRFEPGVVEGGSATTLTIQATDTLSGVKSARGEIQSPSGTAILQLYPQESQDGRSFTYVVNIPDSAETGVWFLKWLYLTDVANNSALIQAGSASMAPPGGTFSVSSSESDSMAPEVIGISFEKDVIEDEDRNVIRVEVRDDLSGVSSVSGACRSPNGAARISFTCALNPETGEWEGTIPLPESADCGEWSVQQLTAKDKAGNTTYLTAEARNLGHAGFTIAPGPECDSTPPTLDGLVLSPTVISGDAANEILISAVVHDVGSGAVSLTGWFEGPVSEGGLVTRSDFTCAPDPEDPDAPWTGTLLVPRFSAKGAWKVRAIELKDKAMNVREYATGDPAVAAGVFEVQ